MSILVGSMSMMRNFKNNLWIPVLLIVLCGCIYIFSKGKCESVFSDTEKKSKEDQFVYQGESYEKVGEDVYEKSDFPEAVQSVLQEEKCESAFSDAEKKSKEDWFVYYGEFYEKAGEDIYKKSDFPETIQSVLQEEENTPLYLKKEENRLIIEFNYHFYIYNFETDHMEEYSTEYGHLGWQICRKTLYFIEKTEGDKKRLMAYDMVSGNVKQIDTGEYEPLQFHVRSDGAIGMWGVNAKGDKEYCFWENGKSVYVADKDESFGWTTLCGFTENGIIMVREYKDWLLGTKIYEVSKDGTINILAGISGSISERDNLKAIPEGWLIYEDNRIVAIDMTSGLVKAYDYDFSCMGELQWDIEMSEDMEFVDYDVEGDGIWGIWKLKDKNVYKRAALM